MEKIIRRACFVRFKHEMHVSVQIFNFNLITYTSKMVKAC